MAGSSDSAPDDFFFDHHQPVFYFPSSTIPVLLPVLGTANSLSHGFARSINDAGVIVGDTSKYSGSTNLGTRAVRWPVPSPVAPQELQAIELQPSGAGYSSAGMVSNSGWVIGTSTRYGNTAAGTGTRVVRWSPTGTTPQELEPISTTPAGEAYSVARDVNASGRVVGESRYYIGSTFIDYRAARWGNSPTDTVNGGKVTQLDTLPLVPGAIRLSALAFAMNDAGATVGWQDDYVDATSGTPAATRAVRWSAVSTVAAALPMPASYSVTSSASRAFDINAMGTIAGSVNQSAADFGDNDHAVLWLPGATAPTFLESLDATLNHWTMRTARAITDTGFVTGSGTFEYFGSSPGIAERTFTMLVPQAGTYGRGDANFDTSTDFNDLVILAQHYNESNAAQSINVADFNLNGVTDFNDLVVLAQNYNTVGTSLQGLDSAFASDWALAQSLVPEPTALALLGVAAPFSPRRRKR